MTQSSSVDNSLFGFSLRYALEHFEKFQELTVREQEVYLMQAAQFENLYNSHFMPPERLAEELGGTPAAWRKFIIMKPVRDFIQRRVEEDGEILQREALYKQAFKASAAGDTQAAKYLAAIVDAGGAESNKKQIILHYIPRPERENVQSILVSATKEQEGEEESATTNGE